ncbi:MAG: signal peptidase II [Lentisphaerae bacterium GWF2_52_8]|nr:MAG: signal peptidase II [Lentisphaerae bacterium GWF2_52_8]
MRRAFVLAGILLLLDQISKFLVAGNISVGQKITIIPNFFNLTYITNPGAAWGILAGKGWLLLLISILVLFSIIFFLRSLTEGWNERYYGLCMVMSGIVGNMIDRIWRGEVVDFIQWYAGSYYWPSFNVADSAITVGVAIFIISSLLRPQDDKCRGKIHS